MKYNYDAVDLEKKWMKEIQKIVRKEKWTPEEATKYLKRASEVIGSKMDPNFNLDSLDDESLSDDEIMYETVILVRDGEGHN